MKRFIFLSLLCIFFTNVMYAQLTKSQVGYIERKIAEAEAEQKKTAEKARQKEREKEQRHEQQHKQHEAIFNRQMNNLNSVSADDYITGPKQKGTENFQTGTYNAEGKPNAPVATSRKANNTYSKGPFGNSGIIGTPSYSGNNYTGDRYNLKPAGFGNIQQPGKTSEQIRGQYKPSRTMNQGVINTRQTHMPSRASMQRSPQHDNTQNVESVQTQRKRGTQKTQQAPNQQRTAQNIASTQMPQKREVPVREQTGANRIVNIDPSNGLHPNTGQDNSSSDLRPVGIQRPDENKGRKAKYTAYNIPNEARHLSDTDNKTLSTYTGPGRTTAQQASLMNKDRMNGYASFDNPREWDYIYGVYNAGTVRTTSRVVTQTR